MANSAYPESVIEVLDDRMIFRPGTLQAMHRLAQSGPWRGSLRQRRSKCERLLRDLSEVYRIVPPSLVFGHLDGSHSGSSYYDRSAHRIVIRGRLSVVTLLHEFAHARKMDEQSACKWSINLFRQSFPDRYARLLHCGHMLLRPGDLARYR